MECKIHKYSIIESYPSILIHKIPLFTILIFFVYLYNVVLYYTKQLVVLLRQDIKNIFSLFKKVHYQELDKAPSEVDFSLDSIDFDSSKEVKELTNTKPYIQKTIIHYLYGLDAVKEIQQLVQDKKIDSEYIQYLPANTNYVLKKEILYIQNPKDKTLCGKYYIVKSYNIPTIKTLLFVDKFAKYFTKLQKSNKTG